MLNITLFVIIILLAYISYKLTNLEKILSEFIQKKDILKNFEPHNPNVLDDNEELIEEAKKVVVNYRTASASFLQRKMSIGYARASRLLDILEERRVVSKAEGAKPRKVLVKNKK